MLQCVARNDGCICMAISFLIPIKNLTNFLRKQKKLGARNQSTATVTGQFLNENYAERKKDCP